MELPRVGIGVGGFLLGSHTGGRSRILDFLPIPCSHADGPSFRLSPEEVEAAKEIARSLPASSVLGCYCSKNRGKAGMSADDRAMFAALCPEPHQFMLVICPSLSQTSRAALFLRVKGEIISGAELELLPPESAVPDDDVSAAPIEVATPIIIPPPASKLPPAPKPEPVPEPALKPASRLFGEPQPAFLAPPPPRRRWLPLVLAAVLLIAVIAGGAWFTREAWMSRPPLQLAVTDVARHVTFKWNAEALRGTTGVTLLVNDGGELKTFPLDTQAVERGQLSYDRKTLRITGTLRAGETRAMASFYETVPEPKPDPPVILIPATPAAVTPTPVKPAQ